MALSATRAALLALAAAGCATQPIPGGGDGGGDSGAPASCGDVAAEVSQWLASHESCTVDNDCTTLSTACGLPGACGTIADTGAPGAHLDGLVAAWTNGHCGPDFCPCPAQPACKVGCNDGACGCKQLGTRPLGAPCAHDADCAGGRCLTGPDYPNGYCSADCSGEVACPAGAVCTAFGGGPFHCYGPCMIDSDCRVADGLVCCFTCGMQHYCGPKAESACHPGCGG